MISPRPRALAIATRTACGSRVPDRSTKQTPSGYDGATFSATLIASVVLPVPPGPVKVRRRVEPSSRVAPISSSSVLRPMSPATRAGRSTPAGRTVTRGGNTEGRSGWTSWNRCSGRPRSLRRCSPRSIRPAPAGSDMPAPSAATSESRTCPPCPAPMILAVRLTVGPKKSPPRWSACPQWMPMRTRRAPVSRHVSDARANWVAIPAATAPAASRNTAIIPSPVVLTTRPAEASIAPRRMTSWRRSAPFIPSGCCSHSRVLPSRSVNRNVRVWVWVLAQVSGRDASMLPIIAPRSGRRAAALSSRPAGWHRGRASFVSDGNARGERSDRCDLTRTRSPR